MVSGGFGDGVASVEVVVPATGQFCSMPDLPDEYRYYHTMDGVYICGGKRSNSLQFSDGEWTIFYEMEESFEGHSRACFCWEGLMEPLLLYQNQEKRGDQLLS